MGEFINYFKANLYSENGKGPHNRMIAIFSSSITAQGKTSILRRFISNTDLRILIATDAFGMGIDIPDIRNIVIHGLSESYPHMWQQIGRACRDGISGNAVIHRKGTNMKIEDKVRAFFKGKIESCIRAEILSNVSLSGNGQKTNIDITCCSFCKKYQHTNMEVD